MAPLDTCGKHVIIDATSLNKFVPINEKA